MTAYALHCFFDWAVEHARKRPDPADCVLKMSPLMLELVERSATFLDRQRYRSDPGRYVRHPICADPETGLSLDVLVWSPGQWTSVHDHAGCWGVVGVVRGVLEERNYARTSLEHDEGVRLHRGGVTLLGPGAVTSFVPNPEQIHVTGVPLGGRRAMSLHLHGRAMSGARPRDVAPGTRHRVPVETRRELA